jgi:hypothetical protein
MEESEEHLLICDHCRDHLDEVAAFAFNAREALQEMPRAPRAVLGRTFSWLPNIGLWRPRLALATAVALIMISVAVYRAWRTNPMPSIAALHLTMARAEGVPVAAPSRELDIGFDGAANASRVVIVNAQHSIVWTGVAAHRANDTTIRVQTTLPEGAYFAQVYSVDGHATHEYEFRIAR